MGKTFIIKNIINGSIADELGINPGDTLLSVNNTEFVDVFDYRMLTCGDFITLEILTGTGEEWRCEIEKDSWEDIGLVFENDMMDESKSCKNHCIFCFIDQLPPGMRESLYFKDDDTRLSFLTGNYVTLTNMTDSDIDRLIRHKLSPIRISVHATDPQVRRFMLKNPKSTELMSYISRLNNAGIELNFQIVLVKGVNDGKILEQSISDLSQFMPNGKSLSVVPVGLTRYRSGLFPVEPFTRSDAAVVISIIENFQKRFLKEHGTRFVYCADEFYLKAGLELPPLEHYEDFPQIENGVGMMRLFIEELNEAKNNLPKRLEHLRRVAVVTGSAAYPVIAALTAELTGLVTGLEADVYEIKNHFFGESVTVSGLLTGGDIINTLSGLSGYDCLLIPENAFRADTNVMLDDITSDEIAEKLNIRVNITKTNGRDFLSAILYGTENNT